MTEAGGREGKLFLSSPSCAAPYCAGQQCPKAHDLSLSLSLSLPSLPYVLRTTLVAARKHLSCLPACSPAQRAAAVIIIFCSHGAFSPIFPCRRRRSAPSAVPSTTTSSSLARSLAPTPLARTRNSLCCLHIFSAISLAVGWSDSRILFLVWRVHCRKLPEPK